MRDMLIAVTVGSTDKINKKIKKKSIKRIPVNVNNVRDIGRQRNNKIVNRSQYILIRK